MEVGTAGRRVLVVEDEPNAREALAELLEGEGFCVLTAANAAAALDLVEAEAPDIVVTDLRMPGGSGDTLVAQVSRLEPELPVLLLTALPAAEILPETRSQVAAVLSKPLEVSTLVAELRRLLAPQSQATEAAAE
jgi:CheY-like chemotaxis protein